MEQGERKNLIQPPDWWRAFEAAAAAKRQSLAEWLGNAGRKALPPDVRATLTTRRKRGRLKSPVSNTTSDDSEKSV